MNQYLEFFGNHPFMVGGFLALAAFLIYTEFDRLTSGVKRIGVQQALRLQNDDNVAFVDVREEKEFKAGHVIDAYNMPVATINNRLQELKADKTTPVVVYCETGMRANQAAKALKKAGYQEVYNLDGGLVSWNKANLPLVTR